MTLHRRPVTAGTPLASLPPEMCAVGTRQSGYHALARRGPHAHETLTAFDGRLTGHLALLADTTDGTISRLLRHLQKTRGWGTKTRMRHGVWELGEQ